MALSGSFATLHEGMVERCQANHYSNNSEPNENPACFLVRTTCGLPVIQFCYASLQGQPPEIFQATGEKAGKSSRHRAVYHPMVVGKRKRQHQAWFELRAVPNGQHP
jgi:hypothetical protein